MKDNDYQPSQATSEQAERRTEHLSKNFTMYSIEIGRIYFSWILQVERSREYFLPELQSLVFNSTSTQEDQFVLTVGGWD